MVEIISKFVQLHAHIALFLESVRVDYTDSREKDKGQPGAQSTVGESTIRLSFCEQKSSKAE
jgi:hypothetical protein